jgi:hypothetical protein
LTIVSLQLTFFFFIVAFCTLFGQVNHVLTENRPQDMDVPETAQVMAHDGNAGSQPNVMVCFFFSSSNSSP